MASKPRRGDPMVAVGASPYALTLGIGFFDLLLPLSQSSPARRSGRGEGFRFSFEPNASRQRLRSFEPNCVVGERVFFKSSSLDGRGKGEGDK